MESTHLEKTWKKLRKHLKWRVFHPKEQQSVFVCLATVWMILAVYCLARPARTWYPPTHSSVIFDSKEMGAATVMETPPDKVVFQLQLNTAEIPELCLLPRIGETLAASIVSYRQLYGPFTSAEDVQKVKGIGPKTYEKIQHHLLPVETGEP